MNSLIKKVAAGVLAAATMLGIAGLGASTANADGAANTTGTLTVTSTNAAFEGKSVNAYQMFKGEPSADGQNATYTLVNNWDAFFKAKATEFGLDVTDANVSEKAYEYVYSLKDKNGGKDLAEFATKASNWAKDGTHNIATAVTPAPKAEASNGKYVATFTNLPLGYYVVSPEAGSTSSSRHTDAMLVNVTSTSKPTNIDLKSEYPTVDKTIDSDKKGDSAQIGSTVNFQLKSKVPDTSEYDNYTFKIVDTLSQGLDYNNDVKVTVGTGDDATELGTGDFTPTYNNRTLTIDLSTYVKTDNDTKAGKAILVKYSATLNKDAFVGTPSGDDKGNFNSAKVQYSNGPSEENIGESTPSETHSYTFNFNLKKFYKNDQNEDKALEGAKFQLLSSDKTTAISLVAKSDNVYRPAATSDADADKVTEVETPASGNIEFTGLKEGTYYLQETFAPNGFNKLSDPVEVKIVADIDQTTGALKGWTVNGSAPSETVKIPVVSIENKKGALLPNTGGMGTVLFTVFGVAIVALGAAWYVKSNRKSRHAA
ncbi:SpaH/EbpB family LPXTG-anchored major pilin [Bifidobacterium platyrrhinorum]|uniref:SpaH/EbpB family LPXTG-anchored major pilin n=1 Tax=Bifidobacterium platyrrhinorum TaxID=2661628 RepID=A0A6L9SW04_9BIFI|nr:SpaH/EbpB family LPXTG-anchored major pilin [Bifidobacterium platyrrhinorum]NEG56033.1 SpaH/EbpB family LPXTG-anchored major pilin [Bifidobacterium platyrrhinorum]